MLTLSRRQGEYILLETSDGPIEVHISRIQGNQVKVSFELPNSVEVTRGELLERDEA